MNSELRDCADRESLLDEIGAATCGFADRPPGPLVVSLQPNRKVSHLLLRSPIPCGSPPPRLAATAAALFIEDVRFVQSSLVRSILCFTPFETRTTEPLASLPASRQPADDQALTGRQAASRRANFTDKNLLDLFHQEHHRKNPNAAYRKPRIQGPDFVILHYAGDVSEPFPPLSCVSKCHRL